MKEKIEWYQEVLELEPGSRIFFPLAKLLAADARIDDAVLTLRHGLARHPDHLEARLMLVELLSRKKAGDLHTEVDGLAALLASYPGFWQAWSERLAADPAMSDASLAMRFLSAALQGRSLSWASVIEQGITTLLSPEKEKEDGRAVSRLKQAFAEQSSPEQISADDEIGLPLVPEKTIADALAVLQPETVSTVAQEAPAFPAVPDPVLEKEALASARSEPLFEKKLAPQEKEEHSEEETEEGFSLRTRSMAEVFAEQGLFSSALEIYQELLPGSSAEERPLLIARMENLAQRLGTEPAPEAPKTEEKPQHTGVESTRLVSLLDSLAQRLEMRAR